MVFVWIAVVYQYQPIKALNHYQIQHLGTTGWREECNAKHAVMSGCALKSQRIQGHGSVGNAIPE
jgi:hypothetical protein